MEKKQYCKFSDCQALWDEESPDCKCGEVDFQNKCKNFLGEDKLATEEQWDLRNDGVLSLPWHANAMGELDLEWITAKRQPFIIGVVGQAEAGKTTLLATLYMLLRSGKSIGEYSFAGSYTLLGWEKIAHFLSFHTHKNVYFPPHTSSNTARLPGLLHFLLKDKKGQYQDVLFTDAPGEWFTNWAKKTEGDESKGARWIDACADAFVIIADTQAFGESIGKARNTLNSVVEKMRNTHQNRPSVLVWTKADKTIDKEIRDGISKRVQLNLSNIKVFDIAVINLNEDNAYLRDNILDLFHHVLSQRHILKNKLPEISIQNADDFFFSLRLNSYGRK